MIILLRKVKIRSHVKSNFKEIAIIVQSLIIIIWPEYFHSILWHAALNNLSSNFRTLYPKHLKSLINRVKFLREETMKDLKYQMKLIEMIKLFLSKETK